MYYDDFYNEPSEADIYIEELKDKIRTEVKEDIINELEKLRKENKELQDVKNNINKLEKEYNQKKNELEKDGIECEIVADTGVVATIHGAHSGKTVALRGDIDDLAVIEQTQSLIAHRYVENLLLGRRLVYPPYELIGSQWIFVPVPL